jgi:hypothetical protein
MRVMAASPKGVRPLALGAVGARPKKRRTWPDAAPAMGLSMKCTTVSTRVPSTQRRSTSSTSSMPSPPSTCGMRVRKPRASFSRASAALSATTNCGFWAVKSCRPRSCSRVSCKALEPGRVENIGHKAASTRRTPLLRRPAASIWFSRKFLGEVVSVRPPGALKKMVADWSMVTCRWVSMPSASGGCSACAGEAPSRWAQPINRSSREERRTAARIARSVREGPRALLASRQPPSVNHR